jgi:cell division septal protein FtsQ
LILDIYPAGETSIEGITTPALIEKIRSFGHRNVLYAPDYEMVESYITANVREGDAVIVMGAGSVTKAVGHSFAEDTQNRLGQTGMKSKLFRFLRMLFVVTGLGCVASVVWAGYHYLHTDPRFNLKKLTVSDLKHVDDSEILSRIQLNTGGGTNIFSVDMDDVRARVEQIEWIHHVTVQRVMPDEIVIRVAERDPKGVARIHGRMVEFDDEAAILEPDDAALPAFPVLLELDENNMESNRRKIAVYQQVVADLGADGISQIIVNSNYEVSIVREGDPLIVSLGLVDFKGDGTAI